MNKNDQTAPKIFYAGTSLLKCVLSDNVCICVDTLIHVSHTQRY